MCIRDRSLLEYLTDGIRFLADTFEVCPQLLVKAHAVSYTHLVTSLCALPLIYKSSKYARKAFNADTVITYPLRMWENLDNKYNHCQVMIIQKKRRDVYKRQLYTLHFKRNIG